MIRDFIVAAAAGLLISGQVFAETKTSQPYAGQQNRAVSSLSSADLEAISKGQGWGLAKPAELNGYPGPIHVLELTDELKLSNEQVNRIRKIYDEMNSSARRIGKRFVASEAALDALFKSQTATPDAIKDALQTSSTLRAELRAAHLNAHIKTLPLLTQHQRHLYAQLRGYANKGSHSGHAH